MIERTFQPARPTSPASFLQYCRIQKWTDFLTHPRDSLASSQVSIQKNICLICLAFKKSKTCFIISLVIRPIFNAMLTISILWSLVFVYISIHNQKRQGYKLIIILYIMTLNTFQENFLHLSSFESFCAIKLYQLLMFTIDCLVILYSDKSTRGYFL